MLASGMPLPKRRPSPTFFADEFTFQACWKGIAAKHLQTQYRGAITRVNLRTKFELFLVLRDLLWGAKGCGSFLTSYCVVTVCKDRRF
jgi:hypothetical protein